MSSGIVFQDCFKTWRADLDKAKPPQATLDWVLSRLKVVDQDILAETARVDNGRLGIPVYISRCGADAARLLGRDRQMGKGATPIQAQVSAVMELVERYTLHSFFETTQGLLRDYRSIRDKAIPLETLALSVHDPLEDYDRIAAVFERLPLAWVWARNLARGFDRLIPFHWFSQVHGTNGSAAGNTLEEATLQGLCEVVERHVVSEVMFRELRTPSIDPASLTDPVARDLVRKLDKGGIRLILKDFTLGLGIPTVGALAYDPKSFPDRSDLVFTAGTTPHPEKSLIRAVTEVAQLSEDFERKSRYPPTVPRYESLEQAAPILEASTVAACSALPDLSHDNLRLEIEAVVAAMARNGLEPYVTDLTHPMLCVPTVYVTAPGAHFRARTRQGGLLFHLCKLALSTPDQQVAGEAIRMLHEALPDRFETRFFLGLAFEREGRLREAATCHGKALVSGPDRRHVTGIRYHLGLCLAGLEDYGGAVDCLQAGLEAAISESEGLAETHRLLAVCYLKLNEREKASLALGRALELEPGAGMPFARMGEALEQLEQVREYARRLGTWLGG